MQLEDLKPSILTMNAEDAIGIHREVRKKRMMIGTTTKKSTTVKKRTQDGKYKKEIKQDPEKIKELLRLLGEDV